MGVRARTPDSARTSARGERTLQAAYAPWSAEDHDVRGTRREQPHRHHAGDLVDGALEQQGIVDAQLVQIENVIAVVGDDLLAPDRTPPESRELAMYVDARHRDDLDGQGERSQGFDELAFVGDA